LSEIILTLQGNIILSDLKMQNEHTHTHTPLMQQLIQTRASVTAALPTVAKENKNASENNHRLLLLRFGKVTANREEI
jgi:hypothetical protein